MDGRRHVRSPLLQPREIGLPAVVSHFLDALAAGDVEDAPSTFTPTGYFRESLPTKLAAHHGAAELRSFFTQQFGAGGGIALRTCLVTGVGVRCAVEFNCARWGTHVLPPQAGIFVHERDADRLLAAVRTYDDIESPPTPASRDLRCRCLSDSAPEAITQWPSVRQTFNRLGSRLPPGDSPDPCPSIERPRLLRQVGPFVWCRDARAHGTREPARTSPWGVREHASRGRCVNLRRGCTRGGPTRLGAYPRRGHAPWRPCASGSSWVSTTASARCGHGSLTSPSPSAPSSAAARRMARYRWTHSWTPCCCSQQGIDRPAPGALTAQGRRELRGRSLGARFRPAPTRAPERQARNPRRGRVDYRIGWRVPHS